MLEGAILQYVPRAVGQVAFPDHRENFSIIDKCGISLEFGLSGKIGCLFVDWFRSEGRAAQLLLCSPPPFRNREFPTPSTWAEY